MTQPTNPLDLSPETARATEKDLQATGTRKPASDEVDRARAAQARATEPRDGDPGTLRENAIVVDADPSDERIARVDESVERAGW